ncbi:MAG: K(+)-transporting ATPase subunit C [Lachnospiraceae bacterium]
MKSLLSIIKKATILTVALIVICGVAYPLALTGISQLVFPKQANGNLIQIDGEMVGSELVGQQFTDPRFFQGRVSSIHYNTYTEDELIVGLKDEVEYEGVASGSYNYGTTNPALKERVEMDVQEFLKKHATVRQEDIPADLLTASGSGLDPHISPKSAQIQIPAIAQATGLSEQVIQEITKRNTQQKIIGVFGEEKVNVLKANIDIACEIGLLNDTPYK